MFLGLWVLEAEVCQTASEAHLPNDTHHRVGAWLNGAGARADNISARHSDSPMY